MKEHSKLYKAHKGRSSFALSKRLGEGGSGAAEAMNIDTSSNKKLKQNDGKPLPVENQ